MEADNKYDFLEVFRSPVLLIDVAGQIIYQNHAGNKFVDGKETEVNPTIYNIVPEQFHTRFKDHIAKEEQGTITGVGLVCNNDYQNFDIDIRKYNEDYFLCVCSASESDNKDREDNTEKHQSNGHVQSARAIFQAAHTDRLNIKTARANIWEWNLKSNNIFISEELAVLFKLEDQGNDITVQQWMDLLDHDGTFSAIKRAIDEKRRFYNQKSRIKIDKGIIVQGDLNVRILYDDDEMPEYLVGLFLLDNKTGLLRRDENYDFRDRLQDVYYSIDAEGKVEYVSSAIEKITGYPPGDFIGKNPEIFYLEKEKKQFLTDLLEENDYLNDFRTEIIKSDGMPVWISANLRKRYDDEGNYNGYEGTIRDVTEIVKTEQKLKESEDRYRQLSELTFEGIIIHENGIVIEANKAICDMVGYTKEELIDNNILELCVAEKWKETVRQRMQEAHTAPYHIEGLHRDGTLIPVEIESRNIEFLGQKTLVTAVRNLTKKIEFENKLHKRERIIKVLEEKIGRKTGKDYFEAVVLQACEILNVKQAFVGKKTSDNKVATIAHALNGEIVDNINYNLENTPCENVFSSGACCYPADIQQLFKQDELLQNEKYEGYVGAPLYDSNMQVIGIIVCLSEEEIQDTSFALSVIQVFSIRSGVEMERLNFEEKLSESSNMLQTILDTIPVRVFWKDRDLRYLGANRRFIEDAGKTNLDELLGKTDHDLTWHNEAELYMHDDQLIISTGQAKMFYEEPQTSQDGKISWLRTSKIPLKDDNGNIYGVLGVYEDITEKKIASKAIEESEKKFRTLAENVPGVIYLYEHVLPRKIIYLNDAVEDLTGLPKDQFIEGYVSFPDIIHPDDMKEITDTIQDAVDNKSSFHLEYRLKHKNNTWKWVEEHGVGIYDEFGLQHIEGFILDVTDRKNNEKLLLESEVKFRTVVESLSGVFWIRDLNTGKIEYLSPQYQEILGQHPTELYENAWNLLDVIHVDDKEEVEKKIKEAEKNLAPLNVEYRVVHGSGEIRTIWARTNVVKDEENKLYKEYGYAEDITEKKLTEEEVKKLALVAERTDNAVVITDSDINIEWVNEGFTRITGYTLEEVIGKNPGRLLQGKGTDFKTVEKIRAGIKNRVTTNVEIVNYNKRGEQYWIELNIQPIYDESSKSYKFISIQNDISSRKNAEELRKRHNIELEKTNQELDNFVYRVSHDLKAPISSAKGLINLAKLEKEPEKVQECMVMIEQSMNKLDSFILDILDYSRNSRMAVEPAEIDLQGTVKEIINNLSHLDQARNIKKEMHVEMDKPFSSDQRRINFILNNILSNAIKFADPEKSEQYIRVSIKVDEEEAVIKCEDNGIGIDEAHLEKIFDMFYRATERMTGSGLGLYIVKEAVDKLNGEIKVESQAGAGTRFVVTIPNLNKRRNFKSNE